MPLMTSEEGHSREVGGLIGFQKVLAAHSFTWIGVQTMFIYLYAYVDYSFTDITDAQLGRIVSISFLSLNLVGALLPAFVLEPYAAKNGRVRTHMLSIAVMAVGYLGVLFLGVNALMIYLMMAVVGVGWAATISLPFAIMSQKIPKSKMGLYMGLFNLSVVLPQLVASLGVGEAINNTASKSLTLWICAITVRHLGPGMVYG